MPTLDWIGKKAVLNHHREVPFRLLKTDVSLSVGDADCGNLLVEGDTWPEVWAALNLCTSRAHLSIHIWYWKYLIAISITMASVFMSIRVCSSLEYFFLVLSGEPVRRVGRRTKPRLLARSFCYSTGAVPA